MDFEPQIMANTANFTTYNEFPNQGDYNSSIRLNAKLKFKNGKIKGNSKMEVKVRKKVKTAGSTNPQNIFQTTFGSLKQAMEMSNEVNSLHPMGLSYEDPNPFQYNYEYDRTPTLPGVDFTKSVVDDQPVPISRDSECQDHYQALAQ